MKKTVLITLTALMGGAQAQNVDNPYTGHNAEDHAQPRPDSSVNVHVVTERQVTHGVMQNGQMIAESSETTVTPSEERTLIESPVKSLPPAEVSDDSQDIAATMKSLGRSFKAVREAGALSEMVQPAQEMARLSSQAEALGLAQVSGRTPTEAEQIRYRQDMQQMRKLIADLEVAIETGDSSGVQILINAINDVRKQGHRYFDVN